MTETYLHECFTCHAVLVRCRGCNGSGCRTRACWKKMQCDCGESETCECSAGLACPRCQPEIGGPVKGWSMLTTMVAFKPYKDMVREAIDEAFERNLFSGPVVNSRGDRINREAWTPSGWHLGVEERAEQVVVKGEVREMNKFRGMAEHEERGIKVRLPSAFVQRIRDKLFPEVPGDSE